MKILDSLTKFYLNKKKIHPVMNSLAQEMIADYFLNIKDLKNVLWAHKRGFTYRHIKAWEITDANMHNYISDVDYARLYPINGYVSFWLNDKITFRYILAQFKKYIPDYYFQINRKDKIIALPDLEQSYNNCQIKIDDIINFLSQKGKLFIKPIMGTVSEGIATISYLDGKYFIDKDVVSKETLREFLEQKRDYLVEEYIETSKDMDKGQVIRVMFFNDQIDNNPYIGAAIVYTFNRAENLVFTYSNVDLETGEYKEYSEMTVSKNLQNSIIKGSYSEVRCIPRWSQICVKINEITQYLSNIQYGAMDVIVTDDDFKILEINSHCSDICQIVTPFMLEGTRRREFFERKLKERGLYNKNYEK